MRPTADSVRRVISRVGSLRIVPDPPRGPKFNNGVISWEPPKRSQGVTHFRIYADNELNLAREVPAGQMELADNLVADQVFITAYNSFSNLESTPVRLPISVKPAGSGQMFWRTLLLKDTTVGDDIADHVTVIDAGKVVSVDGVLRKAITTDLTVQINKNGIELITCTIPSSQAVDAPIIFTSFVITDMPYPHVLSADILNSDGQQDAAGVASFTLRWLKG